MLKIESIHNTFLSIYQRQQQIINFNKNYFQTTTGQATKT